MGVIERVPGTAAWVLAAVLGCAAATVAPAHASAQATGKLPQANASGTAVPPAVKKKKSALRKKVRPSGKARATGKHSPPRLQRRSKPVLSTRGPQTRKAPSARVGRAAPSTLPPPVAWTLPPLGPERFYPNGIPELRPEFLHPLPGAPAVSAQAVAPRAPGAEPEWLP
ncbi:hypothetical protein PE066_13365 [Ramlibacter tataouinensis]|uniref:hypothetical protein n=1 Tax=Ramlibacter tataouinensis TaxID=94132 RepID=UPI0022F3B1D7|nr:hypothetical protein [Ramlibacter tataouinensis]WBY00456.1 hypothetical protein PE066_13365 [Ramlibacter tataouinensis]